MLPTPRARLFASPGFAHFREEGSVLNSGIRGRAKLCAAHENECTQMNETGFCASADETKQQFTRKSSGILLWSSFRILIVSIRQLYVERNKNSNMLLRSAAARSSLVTRQVTVLSRSVFIISSLGHSKDVFYFKGFVTLIAHIFQILH